MEVEWLDHLLCNVKQALLSHNDVIKQHPVLFNLLQDVTKEYASSTTEEQKQTNVKIQ